MKKFATLLLVLLLVFAELLLASCQEKKPAGSSKGDDAKQTDQQTAETAEPAETRLYAEVPDDLNFNDEEVTFLVIDEGYNGKDWRSQDIYQEHDSDEPIASAVFRRNSTIQEKYHVKIAEVAVFQDEHFARAGKIERARQNKTDYYAKRTKVVSLPLQRIKSAGRS